MSSIMTSIDIRNAFFSFFKKKSHERVDSAPIVIKNDPSLMFTNAGMNQFKSYFTGDEKAAVSRVCNTQKCLRVSGKHNDLEEVGVDTYHHTMFEMLGNWSFGDYFKKEAISWAWELLTEVYKIDKTKLYITVFEGDENDGVPFDKEAYDIWSDIVDENKIFKFGKKENFWEMGESGPCGPCSEIHIDLRSDEDIVLQPASELLNKDHPEVIEIWNLVFMEFNRKADKSLVPLKEKHVDTGMGLERLCMVLQNKRSNYDTDLFIPLIKKLENISGHKYGAAQSTDIAIRVIVDHIRALSFSIADGQLPSNTGAGYVIRRILRRAVRYGYSYLNIKDPALYSIVSELTEQFKDVFPELFQQKTLIEKVIREEEQSFLRTLKKGLKWLDELEVKLKKEGREEISGKEAFILYDTYGFPLDLSSLIAIEKGLKVDEASFDLNMQEQKNRSRADAKQETGDWVIVNDSEHSRFIGYDETEVKTKVHKYRIIRKKDKELIQIVLNETPFYAESGGQTGDTGMLLFGEEKIKVIDTKKEQNNIIHYCDKIPFKPKSELTAIINIKRRSHIKLNHSATHLLQASLRDILGQHVAQRGSYLNDKYLRFDFTHFQKMSDEELKAVENKVNEKILEAISLDEYKDMPMNKAIEMGATALFGEKYGDRVRVICFDPEFSLELCGGTHVKNTSEISLFKITSESAIAAGVRRIEAVTGPEAMKLIEKQEKLIYELTELLNGPKQLKQAVEQVLSENKALKDKISLFEANETLKIKEEIRQNYEDFGQLKLGVKKLKDINPAIIKDIVFELKKESDDLCLVITNTTNGKVTLSIGVSDKLVKEKGVDAGAIIRESAKAIQGGGGGQAFYATAGGKNASGIDEAINKVKEMLSK